MRSPIKCRALSFRGQAMARAPVSERHDILNMPRLREHVKGLYVRHAIPARQELLGIPRLSQATHTRAGFSVGLTSPGEGVGWG
jgi:hypothetical protein